MDLNENLNINIQYNKPKNDNYILKANKEINQKLIINNDNKNQSNESLKTTEYSSESGEPISKYIINNCKTHIQENSIKYIIKKDNNKRYNFCQDNNQDINKNEKLIKNNKNKKAPKLVEYNSDYPSYNNTNINAPKIPFIYNINFELNNFSNQSEIGQKEYIKNNFNMKYNKSKEFQKVSIMPHDKLLHLCVSENLFVNKNEKNYNILSVTQRNRHKFITLIYISPKSKA